MMCLEFVALCLRHAIDWQLSTDRIYAVFYLLVCQIENGFVIVRGLTALSDGHCCLLEKERRIRCYRRLLNSSCKDHVTNQDVRRKIQAALRKYDELLTPWSRNGN